VSSYAPGFKKLKNITIDIKSKTKKIPRCRNNSKTQSKNRRNRCKFDTPDTHDRSLSWFGTDPSIKSDGVQLVSLKSIK